MRLLALATMAVAALAFSGQARADFIDFSQFGPTGTVLSSPGTGTTLGGVSFTISNPGNVGFSAYCEDKARLCATNNTWAGEFYKDEVILYSEPPGPVTILFSTPIFDLSNLQAQANNPGAFTETLTAFNGTTQVAIDTANWYNSVEDPSYGEGTIPQLNVAWAGGITSVQISTTNDDGGFALGGVGGVNNNPQNVPEPAGMAVIMLGLLGLAAARYGRLRA